MYHKVQVYEGLEYGVGHGEPLWSGENISQAPSNLLMEIAHERRAVFINFTLIIGSKVRAAHAAVPSK